MKKLISLIIFLALSYADGVIIPPPGYEIESGGQVGILKYFGTTEELSIVFDSYSTGRSIAWIIPLPGPPTINTVSLDLFEELAKLAAPVHRNEYYYGGSCYGAPSSNLDQEYSRDYFEIIQNLTLGFLTTVVIHTDKADSLKNWLRSNGFSTPDNAITLFQEYIGKDWTYFFAAKTDSTVFYDALGIQLSFTSAEPVFPMKISSANKYISWYYDTKIPLYLYAVTDHKMTFDGSTLKYANMISAKELDEIGKDMPFLKSYLSVGNYLTKLEKRYASASEMNADLVLKQAADDKEYRELIEPGGYYYYGDGLLWLIFIWPCYYLYRKVRQKFLV